MEEQWKERKLVRKRQEKVLFMLEDEYFKYLFNKYYLFILFYL